MGLIDCITGCFSGDEMYKEQAYRAVLLGDSAGYFEKVRSIESYTDEQVVLRLKCGGLIIRGERLYIKKYCEGDVAVCGRIKSVERI